MKKPDKKKDNRDDSYECIEVPIGVPEVFVYEIWQDGFELMGKVCEPTLLGEMEGISFEDACVHFFRNDIKFDPVRMTYYGTRLFSKIKEEKV